MLVVRNVMLFRHVAIMRRHSLQQQCSVLKPSVGRGLKCFQLVVHGMTIILYVGIREDMQTLAHYVYSLPYVPPKNWRKLLEQIGNSRPTPVFRETETVQ